MSLQRQHSWIGKLAAVVIVFALATVSVTAAAEEADEEGDELSAEELAERIQHFYGETEDFQAAFLQEYTDIAAGETSRSRGRVYFKKPGMMRWDYYRADRNERDRLLVSDGDTFWVYEYEYQQVFQQCLEDSQLPIALQFLMGEGELLEEFDVELSEDSTAKRPTLELVPKEPTADYKKLEFVINPETFEVSKTTLFDPYGNSNEIDFRNSSVNQNISADSFDFEPPEGARELNPDKECN